MKIVREIPKQIFRGYDIRGIYGKDLNEDIAYTIGKAFGTYISTLGKSSAIIGMDNRDSSSSLKEALIQGVISTGINVIDIGCVTTPMYYFSWELLNIPSGLMITASHNPKEYNGFKFAFDERGNAYGEMIQSFREYILNSEFKVGQGKVERVDIKEEYVSKVVSNIQIKKKMRVVVDSGNGTASVIVKDIFNKFENLEVKYICCESDSRFPNHHPDPSVEANLDMLKKAVLDFKADVGVAFDGDADRVGIVDEKSSFIPIDHYMIIMAKDILRESPNNKILFDVKCTKALEDYIVSLGGTYERYKVGNSYIKAKMKEGNFAFGGEFSGHIFYNDKWPGFDDGIYAALRLLELMSKDERSLSCMQDKVNVYYSSPEIKLNSTEQEKHNIVANVEKYAIEKGYNYSTIDGVRIEEQEWWALIRASQTGPDVTLRFEATTKDKLAEIQDEFEKIVGECK